MNQNLKDEIILSLGNQLIDWTDDTALVDISAEKLDIDKDIIYDFIQNNLGTIFRDFDGIETPLFSYEGWEIYEEIKEKQIQEEF